MRQEERDRARALVADKAVTEVHFGGVSAERWGPEGEAVWYVVDRRYKTAAGLTACRTSMRMDAVTAVVWARRISKVDAFGRDAAWSVLWQTPANKLVVEDQPSETPVRQRVQQVQHADGARAPLVAACVGVDEKQKILSVRCPVCRVSDGPCRKLSPRRQQMKGFHYARVKLARMDLPKFKFSEEPTAAKAHQEISRLRSALPKHEFEPSTLAERTRKVACPVCEAAVGEPCRGKTGHIEGHHADRSGKAKRAGYVRMTKGIR